MITQKQVNKALEIMIGINFKAVPEMGFYPLKDSDPPKYWQIFNRDELVATLYNENYEDINFLPFYGLSHAIIEDPKMVSTSEDKLTLLAFMLRPLTNNRVYIYQY